MLLDSVEDLLCRKSHPSVLSAQTANAPKPALGALVKSQKVSAKTTGEFLSELPRMPSLSSTPEIETEAPAMMDEPTLQKLALEFAEVAKFHPTGWVSKMNLARILEEIGMRRKQPLITKEGWVEAIPPGEGRKIGWYKAGPRMGGTIETCSEPRNEFERAQFMVAEKPKLFEEKAKLEARLREIAVELENIIKIEALLSKLQQATQPNE